MMPTHNIQRQIEQEVRDRWGNPGSRTHMIVMRYWKSTRMEGHWKLLHKAEPEKFLQFFHQGYMEPITRQMIQSGMLARPLPEQIYWETPAERRLYYLLNHGTMPNGCKPPPLKPIDAKRNREEFIRRGNARIAGQIPLSMETLHHYQSPDEAFRLFKPTMTQDYSAQVRNNIYTARRHALHKLADSIQKGKSRLETMLMIDVSGSMKWNPHQGIRGPDGRVRHYNQPPNIDLVAHLVHLALHHMVPRARQVHHQQTGIPTVTFSDTGSYIGTLSPNNFKSRWSDIHVGGGTRVMSGWQAAKKKFFEVQNAAGHGYEHPVYGWQPTSSIPTLSLLVFLDGEALDMDEFELELLGETWAYVTIVLVGMENCPHHHSHAIELERVARFNPRVGFFDVHGRVCERLVVHDILRSVYPIDPPTSGEIVSQKYAIGK